MWTHFLKGFRRHWAVSMTGLAALVSSIIGAVCGSRAFLWSVGIFGLLALFGATVLVWRDEYRRRKAAHLRDLIEEIDLLLKDLDWLEKRAASDGLKVEYIEPGKESAYQKDIPLLERILLRIRQRYEDYTEHMRKHSVQQKSAPTFIVAFRQGLIDDRRNLSQLRLKALGRRLLDFEEEEEL